MKIIINAYQYSSNITGTDRMARNFLRELQKIDTKNSYVILCSSEQYIQPTITSENFKILQPMHVFNYSILRRIVNKCWRILIDYYLLVYRADVYFSFHNMRLPKLRVAKKMIASNLDLIPLVLDTYKGLYPKQSDDIVKASKNADSFMSISNFSKNELNQILDVPLEKINVIPLAADASFSLPAASKKELPDRYIFTVGGSEPRKRVTDVINAFNKLPEKLQRGFPLYIAGGNWHEHTLPNVDNENIYKLGYVPDDELVYLYQNATCFVFASEYEGFGFTILESMAAETPVISATGTSLDEVAGSATLRFKPGDISMLANNIERVITDSKTRNEMVLKGLQQSRNFSWNKSASKLHKLLTS